MQWRFSDITAPLSLLRILVYSANNDTEANEKPTTPKSEPKPKKAPAKPKKVKEVEKAKPEEEEEKKEEEEEEEEAVPAENGEAKPEEEVSGAEEEVREPIVWNSVNTSTSYRRAAGTERGGGRIASFFSHILLPVLPVPLFLVQFRGIFLSTIF
ncbi:hypothetical protein JZ751_019239 [Albula glossodonta]|uniref:Uncharacterized protein n=1 Tax=Albula glossodonta TaxID=121402 RepID=A0A8T2NQG4_9TELE|nr:hypothetical protein JZ751_019239 [Albula glossodonta]